MDTMKQRIELAKPQRVAPEVSRAKRLALNAARAAARKELSEEMRKRKDAGGLVWSRGSPDARIMLVGEGPGAQEAADPDGRPFVGKAGELLDECLNEVGLDPQTDVYVCNIMKLRTNAYNRDPSLDEVLRHGVYLKEQVRIVAPHLIVTLGRYATQYVLAHFGEDGVEALGRVGNISSLSGRLVAPALKWRNATYEVLPILHPAAALHDASKLQAVKAGFHAIPKAFSRGDAAQTKLGNFFSTLKRTDEPDAAAAAFKALATRTKSRSATSGVKAKAKTKTRKKTTRKRRRTKKPSSSSSTKQRLRFAARRGGAVSVSEETHAALRRRFGLDDPPPPFPYTLYPRAHGGYVRGTSNSLSDDSDDDLFVFSNTAPRSELFGRPCLPST